MTSFQHLNHKKQVWDDYDIIIILNQNDMDDYDIIVTLNQTDKYGMIMT